MTDTRKQPEWMPSFFAGEAVIGWRAVTERATDDPCEEGCLAPGSSPHFHTVITGYIVITDRSYLKFNLDGMCVMDGMLHPVKEKT